MADVRLENVFKKLGSVSVIENISLHINDGEFVVFLGPSGSRKSTLLRMIAGLEAISLVFVSVVCASCAARQ